MQQIFILWESTRKKHWYHTGERNSYSKLQTDGIAKLSGRDHEFSKAGRPVRSEDLSGELQGEPGEPQPTESKNDAEVRADFWSIQGDFIYRQHNEPRVQLRVPKEEAFLIPLKYIDWTRTTHTDQDVMQENVLMTTGMSTRTEVCRILGKDSQSSLYRKRDLPEDVCGPGGGWQKFKRLWDQIMYGLKYGPKFGKPLSIENNMNGIRRS